jgi:hypothetical protein
MAEGAMPSAFFLYEPRGASGVNAVLSLHSIEASSVGAGFLSASTASRSSMVGQNRLCLPDALRLPITAETVPSSNEELSP